MRNVSYTTKMDLITLGELRLTGSSFNRHKPLLLLCFLALEGARPRRYLAELFYGDAKNPLNSLSRALSHLRGVSPDFLQTDDASVATSIACDAKLLEKQLDKHDLKAGIELYKAPFLQGVTLELSAELEEWVLVTREHIAGRVREAHLRLGETLAAIGNFDDAARHAEIAYKLAGANELEPEDFARTYTLLSAGGSPQAADLRKEAASFGIRLFLSSDDAKAQLFVEQNSLLPSHNLPRRRTSFVGRSAELKKITTVFTDARHRLLTLLGPGGIGKSRLAVEAAYRQLRAARFQDGTTLVELDPIASPELIPSAIAKALKVELRGSDDPLTQITENIGDSARLLILDNFEHLIAGAGLIHNLLDTCPHLSLLVTSRERLNLADEWVLELTGLSVESNGPGSDALQLFVQRAKRARLGFTLTPDELPHAHAVCDLVGGFPLGIELAAVWIKLLSPADIAAEIKQSLSFLKSPARDVTERQRSINAAFEYSWKLLSQEEQSVMRKLSVFNGGFRKEAAAQVADASLPILASLVDKSLLLTKSSSRYERHALLFQFSQEKLAEAPTEKAETKAKHAHYFHSFLKNAEADLQGPRAKEAMDTIEVEFENIRLAWGWAAKHEDTEALTHSAIPLRLFFDTRGRFQDGVGFYHAAISSLKKSDPIAQKTLGYILVSVAWLYLRLGKTDEATTSATEGIAFLKPFEENKGSIEGLATLSILQWQMGDYKVAKDYAQQALNLTKPDQLAQTARLSEYLGIFDASLGLHIEAKGHFIKALAVFKQLGNKSASVTVLNNLGTLEINTGHVDDAEIFLQEGLDLSRQLDVKRSIPALLNNLAKVALERADFANARRLCQEALEIVEAIGLTSHRARIQETLGRIALKSGNQQEAKRWFTETLRIAHDSRETSIVLETLVWLAQIHMNEDKTKQAASLLGYVKRHTATSGYLQKLTEEALEKLSGLLPASALNKAFVQAEDLELTAIVEMTLNEKHLTPVTEKE